MHFGASQNCCPECECAHHKRFGSLASTIWEPHLPHHLKKMTPLVIEGNVYNSNDNLNIDSFQEASIGMAFFSIMLMFGIIEAIVAIIATVYCCCGCFGHSTPGVSHSSSLYKSRGVGRILRKGGADARLEMPTPLRFWGPTGV